ELVGGDVDRDVAGVGDDRGELLGGGSGGERLLQGLLHLGGDSGGSADAAPAAHDDVHALLGGGGHVGQRRRRLLVEHRQDAQQPLGVGWRGLGDSGDDRVDLAADGGGHGGRAAVEENRLVLGAGGLTQGLGGGLLDRAGAGVGDGDRSGVLLGGLDQVVEGLVGAVGGDGDGRRDRHHLADQVVVGRVDVVALEAQHDRLHRQVADGVAVGGRVGQVLQPHRSRAAGAVLHDDAGVEVLLHLVGEGAGSQVGGAPGLVGDDEGEVLAGVVSGVLGDRAAVGAARGGHEGGQGEGTAHGAQGGGAHDASFGVKSCCGRCAVVSKDRMMGGVRADMPLVGALCGRGRYSCSGVASCSA